MTEHHKSKKESAVVVTNLGEMLRLYRHVYELDLRSLGREIGISAATLMRVEKGHGMDGQTLLKVVNWMLGKPQWRKPSVRRHD